VGGLTQQGSQDGAKHRVMHQSFPLVVFAAERKQNKHVIKLIAALQRRLAANDDWELEG